MNPEQTLAALRGIKTRKLADNRTILSAITLIQDQHKTILRQRKQLADLQAKQQKATP